MTLPYTSGICGVNPLAGKYYFKFTLEGLPKTINSLSCMLWPSRKKHTDIWKRNVFIAVAAHIPQSPLKHAKLELCRYSSSEPDYDGLVSSFKYIIDALIDARVLSDDKPKVIGRPDYRWERAPRHHGFITVEIIEILPALAICNPKFVF